MFPFFDFIPLGGANLSANDFEHPTLARLRESASLLCGWANDVYSFAKETRDGYPINLVKVVANEFGLSTPAALGTAVELYNAELALFESEIAALNRMGVSIRNYVQGLEDFVHGNLAWHSLSGRYR
jgi:5-epi-alpha-selinene synthase